MPPFLRVSRSLRGKAGGAEAGLGVIANVAGNLTGSDFCKREALVSKTIVEQKHNSLVEQESVVLCL